jgi:hypothetical protein
MVESASQKMSREDIASFSIEIILGIRDRVMQTEEEAILKQIVDKETNL